MLTQLFSIGLITLLTAMLPGPDFAVVTKNTLSHSRRMGFYTTLGIISALTVHITYCLLGVAVIIMQSSILFNIIKYLGSSYLIYLGVQSLLTSSNLVKSPTEKFRFTHMSSFKAFRQGLLCNLLNPKATIFFLALFTVVIKPNTPPLWNIIIGAEIIFISIAWFSGLVLLISHPRVFNLLKKAEKYINKILGIILIGFGGVLIFASH